MALVAEGKIEVDYRIVEIKTGDNVGKFQANVALSGIEGCKPGVTYFGRVCNTRGEALSWAVAHALDFAKLD